MIDHGGLAARAEQLRALHRGDHPLILPNAWDAASARAVVDAGFPVVATTSGGMAAALGWSDHEGTPPEEMFAAIARIARVVDVPVTADVEGGYGLPPEELVHRLLVAGAVGCNLEDSDHHGGGVLRPAEQHAVWLAAIKRAARAEGVDIVLNARVDVFIREVGRPETRADEAVRRARLYVAAGADCAYPIGVSGEQEIAELVRRIGAPMNVWAGPNSPSLARLGELGVPRISLATGLFRATMADLARHLADLRSDNPAHRGRET